MINFEALRRARERMDDSNDGIVGRCGNWKIALGGYDMGYEVYYKNYPVMRVNYELDEYEFYNSDYSDVMFTPDTVPQIKKALEITDRFDNVGDIDDVGDYIDHFGQYVNGVEANVSEDNKMKFKKIVKEAKLPVMWAIDFRDMHSGIHGLYYGKDWRDVEEFYNRLDSIYSDDSIQTTEEQINLVSDLWDEFYPRIKEIDEINFRDIGKLPSGKYGIIIDDVEYRLVNVMNCLDVYEESKVKKESVDVAVTGELRPWVKKLMRMIGVGKSKVSSDDKKSLLEAVIAACDKSEPMYADLVEIKDKYFGTYGESKKMGLKFKKISEESTADNDRKPRIYVSTYAKYNNGSLDGKWVELMKFDTYDEFVDYCRALHKDEKDPEFMVQDFENYPKKWYHEAGLPTEEEFEKIYEYYLMNDNEQDAYEAFVDYTGNDNVESFRDAYEGRFNSAEDFAYHMVDNIGWDGVGKENLETYFDYDAFGRDMMFDYSRGEEGEEDAEGNPQDPDHYYDQDGYDMGEYESDRQVAEDFIDNIGGVDQLGKETASRYFDYEAFGRDLLINDYFEENGYYFSRYY